MKQPARWPAALHLASSPDYSGQRRIQFRTRLVFKIHPSLSAEIGLTRPAGLGLRSRSATETAYRTAGVGRISVGTALPFGTYLDYAIFGRRRVDPNQRRPKFREIRWHAIGQLGPARGPASANLMQIKAAPCGSSRLPSGLPLPATCVCCAAVKVRNLPGRRQWSGRRSMIR
jgi:hypothetical protein